MNWKKRVSLTLGFIFVISMVHGQGYEVIEQIGYYELYREGDKIGIKDDMRIVIPASDYDRISWDAELQIYKCFKGKEFYVFDESGKEMFPEYKLVDIKLDSEHYLITTSNGTGVAEGSKIIVPPLYDKVTLEFETYFSCCLNIIVEKNNRKGLYVGSKLMIPAQFDDFKIENYDYLIVSINEKYGMSRIDNDTLIGILPVQYDKISPIKESEEYEVKKDKFYGILGMNYMEEYQFYVPLLYKDISWSKKGEYDFGFMVPVKTNKEKGFVVSSIEMDSSIFSTDIKMDGYHNIIIKDSNGKYGVLDYKLSYIVPSEYDMIEETDSGLLEVKKDGKWGLMEDYKILVEPKYQDRDQLKADEAYY